MEFNPGENLEGAKGLKSFIDWSSKKLGDDNLFYKQMMLFMLVRLNNDGSELADIIDEFVQNTVFGYFNMPINEDNCWEDEDRCNDCPVDYPNKECPEFRANECVCDKPIFNPQVDGSIKCDICHKPVKGEVKQC